MTQKETLVDQNAAVEMIFRLISVALVGLSVVLIAAAVWFTIGPILASGVNPIALGTVVFTVAAAIVFKKTADITSRKSISKR